LGFWSLVFGFWPLPVKNEALLSSERQIKDKDQLPKAFLNIQPGIAIRKY